MPDGSELRVKSIRLEPLQRVWHSPEFALRVMCENGQRLTFRLTRKQAIELEADCLVELKSGALSQRQCGEH